MSTHTSSRRTTIKVLFVMAVIAAVTVVLVTRKDDTATVAAASIFKTAAVEQGTLGTSESIDGSVALSDVTTVLHRIEGQTSSSIGRTSVGGPTGGASGSSSSTAAVTQVVTSVIGDGAAIVPGTVLYSVEGSPVVALGGVLPAWRTLSSSSADGADVEQLERSLVALGYDPNGTITIDQHFDSATAAVVKAWQAGYGLTVTGKVALGSVVFLPDTALAADTTVAGVNVAIGDSVGDGDEILSLATTEQQVVIDVPDGAESYLVPGLVVKVGTVSGTIDLLRSIDRSGTVVVQAVITPEAPIEGAANGSSVKVTVTVVANEGVLLVPAEALVSRLDGSYAVQVVQADGSSTFVTVELLGVSGNKAGIRGDGIVAGSEVLQPV